jgi:FG-GAP-like repeat
MASTPSAPDRELSFQMSPLKTNAQGKWDVVKAVWLKRQEKPALFGINAKEAIRLDKAGDPLPFPGGKDLLPPSEAGLLAIDWNNDFRTDILLAGAGGLRFFQQDEDGGFKDVTSKTKLPEDVLKTDYYGGWAADIDMDGDLDIIVAPRKGPPLVLRNNGEGTFTVVKPFAGVDSARCFAWADLDHDGAPDAAFVDSQGKLHVFMNERSGQFQKRAVPDQLGRLLTLGVADVTDDGVFDLLGLRDDGVILRLSDRDKRKSWDTADLTKWPSFPSNQRPGDFRLLIADLDNNGGVDMVVSGPSDSRAWLSDEEGKFDQAPLSIASRAFAVVDLDGDGRLDLLGLSKQGEPVQETNHGKKDYHWQVLWPHAIDKAAGDNRINSFGIGGEIEVRSGLLVQKQPITAPLVHIGLGEQPKSSVVRILWPNGSFQAEFDLESNAEIAVVQRLKGSCPYLFTFDGNGMQFVTDFMWSTPLGMYINAQDKGGFLQTTEWVKIRGDQLVPRDGRYEVRVTANLWETHFFDYMALMAIDHPPDTEMYVDERFALTPMKPEVHLTSPPRSVAQAWDDNGKEVTEVIRKVDGIYLDTFGRGKFQGVTRDHYVEVELGEDAPKEGPVWLLANGWVHPTDSSINVAIGQGDNPVPRAIVLEVPDGKGGWKVGRNDIGFPAGKNKTVMIRLDGIAGNAGVTRRFRLRTNMEIYWDALQYAKGRDGKLVRQQTLSPETAELRYHGISLIMAENPSSPELPTYDTLISKRQYWRDLIGYHTRYGDVRELLEKIDDRYVIVNAGD